MGRKRYCELPFCNGIVEGTRNKRRCDNDRNIHLHQVISKNVRKIMRYVEGRTDFTANDVTRDLFKNKLDKNEKGSMYRLFQAMVREGYLVEHGKKDGLKMYAYSGAVRPAEADLMDGAAIAGDHQFEPEPQFHGTQAPVQVVIPAPQSWSPPPQPEFAPPPPPQLTPHERLVGKLREFVHLKGGTWNHDDWLWLINRPDIREFGISEAELGPMLEEEKARFWARR